MAILAKFHACLEAAANLAQLRGAQTSSIPGLRGVVYYIPDQQQSVSGPLKKQGSSTLNRKSRQGSEVRRPGGKSFQNMFFTLGWLYPSSCGGFHFVQGFLGFRVL